MSILAASKDAVRKATIGNKNPPIRESGLFKVRITGVRETKSRPPKNQPLAFHEFTILESSNEEVHPAGSTRAECVVLTWDSWPSKIKAFLLAVASVANPDDEEAAAAEADELFDNLGPIYNDGDAPFVGAELWLETTNVLKKAAQNNPNPGPNDYFTQHNWHSVDPLAEQGEGSTGGTTPSFDL